MVDQAPVEIHFNRPRVRDDKTECVVPKRGIQVQPEAEPADAWPALLGKTPRRQPGISDFPALVVEGGVGPGRVVACVIASLIE